MSRAPKVQPTQEVLGNLFDDVDRATDYAQTVYFALAGAGLGREAGAIAAVLSDLGTRLDVIKATLHDMVEWHA